ncbi:hypothetical protein EST38_g1922 [Candolleomyces aberdarensis]|uniref:Cytochrome P450 n=1 Tax=Candolleomyces aberdarensis TaxID=2316362 RepID=A0A4Q2DXD1_9AGAR|nr:hypothetical protein EST38_g1922 [Candolleomyces aberdarensis]
MGLPSLLVASLVAALLAYWSFKVAHFFYDYWNSPVRRLPGPPSASFVYGHEKEVDEGGTALIARWVEKYGPTMRLQSFIGMNKLYTADLKALNHIMMNSYTYQKPEWLTYRMEEVVGKGILSVEGDTHKRQRKVMNPAFSASQIRELSDIFVEKSLDLRDIWEAEIRKQGGVGIIDVNHWLYRATLDIIGLAGFNYEFNALSGGEKTGALHRAFGKVLENLVKFTPLSFLRAAFPALRWLPERVDSSLKVSRGIMDDIGRQLIATGKQAIHHSSKTEQNSLQSKDLLTVLLRSNMATDIPEDERMSEDEVNAQIFSFMAAGQETSSTATVWALYALMKAPDVQKKLRNELLQVPSDSPSADELNALPYLDAVIRECLRLHTPLPLTFRISAKDDVLPLSTPVRDTSGKTHESIHIQKGQMITIPIIPIHEEKTIWGEDSLEFRPERWERVPEAANAIPGAWGNTMAFFGGPRACIGYRFALLEMKALLFALIRAFELEPAGPVEDIGKKLFIVYRPFLKSDPEAGTQLPLKVRLYQEA